jgi:hypothetical protein
MYSPSVPGQTLWIFGKCKIVTIKNRYHKAGEHPSEHSPLFNATVLDNGICVLWLPAVTALGTAVRGGIAAKEAPDQRIAALSGDDLVGTADGAYDRAEFFIVAFFINGIPWVLIRLIGFDRLYDAILC